MTGPVRDRRVTPSSSGVCIISEGGQFGGLEVHTLALAEQLVAQGIAVTLVQCRSRLYDEPLRQTAWGAHVRMVYTDLSVGFASAGEQSIARWRALFRTIEADTLVFPRGRNDMGTLGFLIASRLHFRRIYFIDHLEDPPLPKSSRRLMGVIPLGLGLWWYRIWLRKTSRFWFADRVIAVSDAVRRRLAEDWSVPERKLVVVRNGVPWERFDRDPTRGASIRASLGLPEEAFVFGMLVRLGPEKGIDLALRALACLLKTPGSRIPYLVVAGEGTERNTAALRTLADELGVSDHVRWVGFARDVRSTASAFDVILFSSRLEGLPLGLLEGMAAGCVPIVTKVSGMPEVVDSPEVGWVVPPEDHEALAAAMLEVLRLDDATLSGYRSRAQRRVRDAFDLRRSHRRLLEALELQPADGQP